MDLTTYLARERISQAELARRLSVSPGLVWQWLNGRRQVAAEQVLPIERATNGAVSRHEIRPDIYPQPNTRRQRR
jgi:DNA-binding transcriptional regulator YdaS (Cro superfamily)